MISLNFRAFMCLAAQGRREVLKSGGAGVPHLWDWKRFNLWRGFWPFLPQSKGCTCTSGTPSSEGPAAATLMQLSFVLVLKWCKNSNFIPLIKNWMICPNNLSLLIHL